MEIEALQTEEDYKNALLEVHPYFDTEPMPGSADAERFEQLLELIEAYEVKHKLIVSSDDEE